MTTDFLGFLLVAVFGLFLLVGLSVTAKGILQNWRSYRSKVLAARLKRNV